LELRPREYVYTTELRWDGERRGTLRCDSKPRIKVACPPEWGGHEGAWSPEDLFVGSLEVCVMTTFLHLAGGEGIVVSSYDSESDARAMMDGDEFRFTSVSVRPRIGVTCQEDIGRVKGLLADVEELCLVSRSIRSTVTIDADVFVKKRTARRRKKG